MPGASSKQFLWVALVSHGEVALNTEHLVVQAERPSTVQGAVTRSWQSSRSKSRVPPHSPSCWGGPAVSAGVGAPEKPPEQPPNGCSTARIFRTSVFSNLTFLFNGVLVSFFSFSFLFPILAFHKGRDRVKDENFGLNKPFT